MENNMDIKQIKYFIEITNHKSYSLAAKKLGISQPALSSVVKKLEQEIGGSLFFYDNKKLSLTDIGEEFYQNAFKLVDEYNVLMSEMNDIVSKDIGKIRLGCPVVVGSTYVADVVGKFRKDYPKINFEIVEAGAEILTSMLEEGKLDIAAAVMPVSQTKFEMHDVLFDRFVIVVSKNHPLANKESVRFSELKDEIFTSFTKAYTSHHLFMNNCDKAGFKPKILVYSDQWDFMTTLIANNLCIAMLPYPIMKKHLLPSLKLIEIEDAFNEWNVSYITKKNHYKSKATSLFIDYLKEYNKKYKKNKEI
jgi:DNA-binding transcriptional LysR family regulator